MFAGFTLIINEFKNTMGKHSKILNSKACICKNTGVQKEKYTSEKHAYVLLSCCQGSVVCVMCSCLLCPYLVCFLSSSDVIMS